MKATELMGPYHNSPGDQTVTVYVQNKSKWIFVAYCLEEAKPLCHRVVSPCVTPQEAQKYTVPVVPQ